MNKTSLFSLAAVLATSAALCESAQATVHSAPDLGNTLEQRIERKMRDGRGDSCEYLGLRACAPLRGVPKLLKACTRDDRVKHAVALVASPPEGQ